MERKFFTPKVSYYSNKLRAGLGRRHLEQKNYCFKFDGQIQVGKIGISWYGKENTTDPWGC